MHVICSHFLFLSSKHLWGTKIGGKVVLKGMAKLIFTSDGRFGGTYMETVMLSSAPKMFFSLIKKTSIMETSSSRG